MSQCPRNWDELLNSWRSGNALSEQCLPVGSDLFIIFQRVWEIVLALLPNTKIALQSCTKIDLAVLVFRKTFWWPLTYTSNLLIPTNTADTNSSFSLLSDENISTMNYDYYLALTVTRQKESPGKTLTLSVGTHPGVSGGTCLFAVWEYKR